MQRSIGPVPMFVIHRIEGALGTFIESLSVALQKIFPLPHGKISEPLDSLPPPRVAIDDIASQVELEPSRDPLVADRQYHTAKLISNTRITAEGWNQDVRHFEFKLDEDVQ